MRETKRPRSVRTILRRIIRLGRYGADRFNVAERYYERTPFMCIAASIARYHHEITPEEYERVVGAIAQYIGTGGNELRHCMQRAGLTQTMSPDEFASTVGRELYWNWNKRPDLTPKL